MLQNAPSCPECSSRSTQWLPATSDVAFVDYFRCYTCGSVWVVGDRPEDTRQITAGRERIPQSGLMFLHVEIDAGLLFAGMAQKAEEDERRSALRLKARTALEAVERYMPRIEISKEHAPRLAKGLQALKEAIDNIPG